MAAAVLVFLAVEVAAAAGGSGVRLQELGLYQIQLDGTGRTQLLSPDADVVDIVAVSPDRTRILMHRLPSYDLYSALIDGSDLRLVASRQAVNGYPGAASWSPSGARIAFEVSSTHADIWVANSDGTSRRRLVNSAVEPSWSPSGRRIAYVHLYYTEDPAGAITVGRSTGPLRLRQLGPIEVGDRTGTNPDNWMLRWSPHGSVLAYTVLQLRGEPRARERVAIVRANGPLRRSVHPIRAGRFRAWSPTGKRIVYSEGKSKRLILARADGSHRGLTTGLGPVEWSPDGRWIAFVDEVGRGCYQIFLIRPNGKSRHQLTREACSARFGIYWAPDSRKIDYILTVYVP
jgi:Tol biopolymer transport system component